MLRYKVYAKQARVSYPGGNVQSQPECQKLAGKIGWVFVCTFWTKNFLRPLIFFQNPPLLSSIFFNFCWSLYWHERPPFQSVAVQAVDWHDDSGPLFSLFFSATFPLFSVTTFSHRRSAWIKKLI